MPIPTDTFWNIKRLNWVFAISSVILLVVTAWSILQDYGHLWREPQKQGRVWEAAMTRQKIDRDLTPDKQEHVQQLQAQIAAMERQLERENEQYRDLEAQIQKLDSDRETLEFSVNTIKSDIAVFEAQLQDAITARDQRAAERIRSRMARPMTRLNDESEQLARVNMQLEEARQKRMLLRAELDEMIRQRTRLAGDVELMQKKLQSLQPESIVARLSNQVRAMPLMGFINPSEGVKQVVLPDIKTDVAFMQITTIDRCITCHVNIQNRDFTEENVVAYLEEQSATARGLALPAVAGTRAADAAATAAAPGPVAMVEFWQIWTTQLAPDAIRRQSTRINTVANSVGKGATVTFDGQPVTAFKFDANLLDPKARAAAAKQPEAPATQPNLATAEAQNEIVVALLKAWYRYAPAEGAATAAPVVVTFGRARVEIANVEKKAADPIRTAAMRYAEEIRNGLRGALDARSWSLLEERYRWALVREVNVERRRQRLPELDPSPVFLAHPRLDLYADQDSPHPMDSDPAPIGMGCTVCHDGSGQETDFVLTAHVPRPIWVDSRTGEPVLPTQFINPPPLEHAQDMSDMLSMLFPDDSPVPSVASQLHFAAHHEHDEHHVAHADGPLDQRKLLQLAAAEDARPVDYVDPVTGRRGKAVSQMQYWKNKYEPHSAQSFYTTYHYWDWPMREPQYIQANCIRCHTEVNDIREEAPVLYEGRQLFTNLGCVNCHQMDSIPVEQNLRVGTDLRHVSAKLSPEFLNSWIWAPKAFRPSTKMPHFFMLENNSSDEEIHRTRQEARAMTEFLVRTSTPLPPLQPIPAEAKGSPEAGKLLFHSIGCLACHQNLGDETNEKREGHAVTVGEKWITTDLTKKPQFVAQVAEKLGKTPQAADLMKEARALYDGMSYNERQLYVQQHLSEPAAYEQPAPRGAPPTLPRYPDGTPRPQFVQVGPELSAIGTKLTTGRSEQAARQWLFDWLKEPRHYSEYTIMPRLRLSDQQALDLTEYLLTQTRQKTDPNDPWRAVLTPPDTAKLIELTAFFLRSRYSVATAEEKADDLTELRAMAIEALTTADITPEQAAGMVKQIESEPDGRDTMRMLFLGKRLIGHYGCMSCHSINGTEMMTSPCTNLSDWGQKGIDKLDFGYLDHHKLTTLPPTSKIPMVNGLSARSTHLLDPRVTAGETASADESHAPAAGVAREFEAAWPHLGHNRVDWITQKLRNSRAFDRGKALLEPGTERRANGLLEDPGKPYDKLKMPTFYLTDDQVHAIATFVISNRDRLVSTTLTNNATTEQARLIARGRDLAERYNCVGCHQVELNVPQIQQYARPDEVTTKWPPSLRGQGNKVQYDWLFNFFKDVEPLRPLLVDGIRMPSFDATDAEWRALIAYFNAVSTKESNELREQLQPVYKSIHAQQPPAGNNNNRAAAPTGEMWPEDDWWTRREFAAAAEYLKNWALVSNLVREIELDPTKNTPEQLNRTYKQMLFKARFVEGLFDAPFPFVDSGRPNWGNMTPEQREQHFKLGEQLFYEMQCLACHVLGDPSVEGAQKNPTAPNLSLTHNRLQRSWVRHWVQEPAIIQVGTAMPPFLTGLPVFNLHGQPWPRSQDANPEEVKRVEATYGDTPEKQARLVLDFLYEAGLRQYTGVQPTRLPAAAPAAQDPPPTAAPLPPQPPPRPEMAAEPGAATQPATEPPLQPPTPESPGAPAPVPQPQDDPQQQPQQQQQEAAQPDKPAEVAMAAPKDDEPVAPAPAPPQAAGAAAIVGTIKFEGEPPQMPEVNMSPECGAKHAEPHMDESVYINDDGTLRNVVIFVSEGLPPGETYPPPAEPAVLNQDGCVYIPHVLAMQAGQKLLVQNSDPFLHNVHSLAQINPAFNFGQPNIDNKPGRVIDSIKAAEVFRIKCDVHPWMSAHVHVFEHPFYSVTGEEGTFSIANLPPGNYTITARHETLGDQTQEVVVEEGKPVRVEMSFSP